MIELIKNPSYDFFINQVQSSERKIVLCSPELDSSVLNEVLINKKKEVKLILITSHNITSFMREDDYVDTYHKLLKQKNKIYNYKDFNARFYVFDDKVVWITSSSLTYNGLNKNFEYGVFTNEEKIIDEIVIDYHNIIKKLKGKDITVDDVSVIEKNVKELKDNDVRVINKKIVLDSFTINALRKTLKGWNLLVFETIYNSIETETFVLEDVYKHEDYFKLSYPNNFNIKAKIRQTIQDLRNFGYIEFVDDNGTYKKNWI
ncbi:MAG: phospholipase D-like domain-containing protein [Acholeplasma sp.]|nr:phospholipase D-like domain-containing protein [Acholeplasma sp.]